MFLCKYPSFLHPHEIIPPKEQTHGLHRLIRPIFLALRTLPLGGALCVAPDDTKKTSS